jgi:CelD/BcsL family acetyltransferase involved in cellulose biosynthesis
VLDHAHETFAWWTGAHPEARAVSASRALMVWAIRWAAARGRARFNLGGSAGLSGVSAFKHSLGARDVEYPVRWLAPRGVRGRIVAGLKRLGRPARRRGAA